LIVAGAMLSELDFSPDSRIYMVVVMLSLLEWPRLAPATINSGNPGMVITRSATRIITLSVNPPT
jgi:hypothetical protein